MFDSRDYLDVARDLVKPAAEDRLEEARCRSAISRIYYGVYGVARAFSAERHAELLREGSVHTALIRWFRLQRSPKHQKVAVALDRLFERRKEADYGDDIVGDPRTVAEECLREAEKTLQLMGAR